jgi:hypothetical protein
MGNHEGFKEAGMLYNKDSMVIGIALVIFFLIRYLF